jgi:hypothetical protein
MESEPAHESERAHVAMGSRRYCINIPAPFNTRLKTRLERAVTHAIINPSRALPTLRRAVLAATTELRVAGYEDPQIHSLFTTLIEDVARDRAFDGWSVVSGQPRWMELCTRVVAWTNETSVDD